MNCKENDSSPRSCSLIPFGKFLEDVGKSSVTGWRWRKAGFIATVNVAGKVYISEEEIRRFEARAIAGEFSRMANTQRREEVGV